MGYLMMFLAFWFVGFCLTLVTGYKPTIKTVIEVVEDHPMSFFSILSMWPIIFFWIYDDWQKDVRRRKMHEEFDKDMVDRMFINMGMEKINDPNTRLPNRI